MKRFFLSVLFVLPILVFNSCDRETEDSSLNEFDYSLYENKESLFSTLEKARLRRHNSKSTGLSEFENAITVINEEYGTSVYVSNFDQFLIDNPSATIDEMLQRNYITQEEYDVVSSFFNDLDTYNFDESIEKLEERIIAMNLNQNEFEKYNYFVNGLMVTNEYYLSQGVNIFTQASTNKAFTAKMSAGCAVAIASNAVSTIGLASCAVPGPWCALAVVGKGLSLAGIFLSC